MDPIHGFQPDDIPLNFSSLEWGLIFTAAAMMRLLPLMILVGAILKRRRFPDLQALHTLLLVSLALLAVLALADGFGGALIPDAVRDSGFWPLLWVFAIAWVAVIWVRSMIKTRLRPRWIEIPTLIVGCILAASAALLFLPSSGAGL